MKCAIVQQDRMSGLTIKAGRRTFSGTLHEFPANCLSDRTTCPLIHKDKKAGGPEVITGVITKDHKPEDKSEKKRIKALGGSVSSKGVGHVKKKVHHTN